MRLSTIALLATVAVALILLFVLLFQTG